MILQQNVAFLQDARKKGTVGGRCVKDDLHRRETLSTPLKAIITEKYSANGLFKVSKHEQEEGLAAAPSPLMGVQGFRVSRCNSS